MQNFMKDTVKSLNPLANMKVSNKFLSLIILMSVLTAVVGWRGIDGVDTINGIVEEIYNKELLGISYVKEANSAMLAFARAERNYLLVEKAKDKENFKQAMDMYASKFEDILAKAEGTLVTEQGKKLIVEIKEQWKGYLAINQELLNMPDERNEENVKVAVVFAQTVARSKMDEIDTLLSHLAQNKEARSQEAYFTSGESYANIRNSLLMLVFGAIAAGLALGLYMSRIIVRPVLELNEVANKVSGGDTTARVRWVSADELGSLSSSFNTMIATIEENNAKIAMEKEAALEASRRAEELAQKAEEESRYLAESVNTILEGMERFAGGDLTASVQSKRTDDDIARLCDGFNGAVANIRELIVQVLDAVEHTAAATQQVTASTTQMAATAEEQSAQTTEIAAAVQQMTSSTEENARNTTMAAEISQQSRFRASDGAAVVRSTIEKMKTIAGAVHESAGTVKELGSAGEKIGEIISVIDEIADQTNLLALNAAIEAARAGEQGRGFAVVADEVRKLAERTVLATKEIAQTVKSIQAQTGNAVIGMERGIKEVEEGISLADNAGEALLTIVEDTDKVESMVGQIASSTEEQSATSIQIAQSIEGISAAAHENAASVGEVVATMNSLNSMTEQLRDMLLQFEIGANAPAAKPSAYSLNGIKPSGTPHSTLNGKTTKNGVAARSIYRQLHA